MFSGGLELAVGERDVNVHDMQASGGGAYWSAVYDARVRFDVWATPHSAHESNSRARWSFPGSMRTLA